MKYQAMHSNGFSVLPVPRNQLAESPFWHPQEQCLYWCDIKAKLVHAYCEQDQQLKSRSVDSEPGCIAPTDDGRLVVALRDKVVLLNTETCAQEQIAQFTHDAALFRSNDGKCDSQGRFWIGSVNELKDAETAGLWCLKASGKTYSLALVESNNITANGLAFSLDESKLYWAHTAKHRVDMFDFDSAKGKLSARRTFINFPDKTALGVYGGRPDGAAVDAQGCYWVAMYEGGCVLRISPGGEVLERLDVPTHYPTMPCFGGADLQMLYVTSAASPNDPASGMIYATRVAVPGRPVNTFRVAN
jgi:sugar lactone lactonase YvrE